MTKLVQQDHPEEPKASWAPSGFLARSLLLIAGPVLLLQISLAIVFFDRHWDQVTERLSRGVGGDLASLVALLEATEDEVVQDRILARAQTDFEFVLMLQPEARLTEASAPRPAWEFNWLYNITLDEVGRKLRGRPFTLDMDAVPKHADFRITTSRGVLRALVPIRRISSTTAHIMLMWMVGISAFLLLIAILFLRNQVRSVVKLADAADHFGRGLDVPDFKPSGAQELRLTAQAFLDMKDRIDRQMAQRTDMLAGVSHDLRTPLARMKLDLEMLQGREATADDISGMKQDIRDLERMLDEYLDFARGLDGEAPKEIDIAAALTNIVEAYRRHGTEIDLLIVGRPKLMLRPTAFRRMVMNLMDNASRFGSKIWVEAARRHGHLEIAIEDDGPGIPEDQIGDAFKPFKRLDQGRNLDIGGVGLGMTIALDAARGHGGGIELSQSINGGLKALIKLPHELEA